VAATVRGNLMRHRTGRLAVVGCGIIAVTALWAGTGCSKKAGPLSDPEKQQLVGLVMPEKIKIVEAFTTFRSFDEDNLPDGIALMVQPLDFYGDPVKIAGTIRAELFTFVPASGVREGERVCDPWEISLASEHDERTYWNVVTGMYEFPLELPAGITPAGAKYVLDVTYNSPLDTHLQDSLVLEVTGMGTVRTPRPKRTFRTISPGAR
jgi:hypothetical protein